MSNTVGPVCHIPPPFTPGNPQPLNMPGLPGPATDLVSAIALINSMRAVLAQMVDTHQSGNNTGVTNNFITQSDKKAQWVEVDRQVEKVRVYQNNDKTSPNYVDVEQINQLTMQDRRTGALWRWHRNGQRR